MGIITRVPKGEHGDYNSKRLFVVSYQETDQRTIYLRIERTTYCRPYLTQKKTKHEFFLYLCERLHDYIYAFRRKKLHDQIHPSSDKHKICLIKVKKEEAISGNCFSFYFFFASFSGLILIGSRRKDSVQK